MSFSDTQDDVFFDEDQRPIPATQFDYPTEDGAEAPAPDPAPVTETEAEMLVAALQVITDAADPRNSGIKAAYLLQAIRPEMSNRKLARKLGLTDSAVSHGIARVKATLKTHYQRIMRNSISE